MKIERNGQEFELTFSELMAAHDEYRLDCAIADMNNVYSQNPDCDIDLSDEQVKYIAEQALHNLKKNESYYDAYWESFKQTFESCLEDIIKANEKNDLLVDKIAAAEKQKEDSDNAIQNMTYGELCKMFRAVERTKNGHVTGYVVITADSFTAPYSEIERTYIVSSNNKAFQPNMGGYSIHASSLDGSDKGIRLEGYLAAERGGKDGWEIERCYMKKDELDKANAILNDKNREETR